MHPAYRQISKIGLGCVTFGREIDKRASFVMMDHAFERGINFFDTAAAYGEGLSESIVGEWLSVNARTHKSMVIATKLQPPYTRENIRVSVNNSLHRLGTDAIDLLYFHRWSPELNEASLRAMSELVTEGKVRFLGASNFTAEQMDEAVKIQTDKGFAKFDFAQNNHNFAVRDITPELCGICRENNIRLVAYSPLGAGFLTGKHQRAVQPDSRFERVPGHDAIYFLEKPNQLLAKLQQFAVRWGRSTTALALAWAFHQRELTAVLIGGRIPAHIDQAFDALAFDDLDLLDKIDLT